jgi:translation initiation factor 2 beta subunit (eIF-2beta)/eIF-5
MISVTAGNVTVQGESQKEVFEQLAQHQEIFGQNTCGACNSEDTRFVVREAQSSDGKRNFKYYEMRCNKCGARLSFGQHSEGGTLFPKRKDGENWLPNNGWTKFEGTPERKF